MSKMTDWFDQSKQRPWEPGVYEVEPSVNGNGPSYQHWNGKWWGYFCSSIERAILHKGSFSTEQNRRWRGLAKKP